MACRSITVLAAQRDLACAVAVAGATELDAGSRGCGQELCRFRDAAGDRDATDGGEPGAAGPT